MWQNLRIFTAGRGRRKISWRLPAKHKAARGFDIANIRDFAPGDSPRVLNRKRLLLSDDEVVYERYPDCNALLLVLFDISGSEYTGGACYKSHAGIKLIHYLGRGCLERGHLLQVVAFSDMIEQVSPVIVNPQVLEETLAELQDFSPAHRATDGRDAIDHAFFIATRPKYPADMVCLVSDLLFPAPHAELYFGLADLQEVTDVTAICLQDRIEIEAPPARGPFFGRDAETGELFWSVAPRRSEPLPELQGYGIDTCFLETDQSEEEWYVILSEFFSTRSRRGKAW